MAGKRAASAGMLGPVIFVATFTIEGVFRPGYDARSMFVSALSLGSAGWIQILSFVVLGVLFLWFTRGVAADFPEGKASRAGPLLLAVIGVCYLLSGPFMMDPANTPRDQATFHGTVHGVLGALVFTLSPVTCFVFLRRFREDAAWRSFRHWTLAAGILSVAFVALLSVATKPPLAPNGLTEWAGVIQRMAIVTNLGWVYAFAAGQSRRNRAGMSGPVR